MLLNELERDFNEDVDNAINDSDKKFLENYEIDYNSGFVANTSNILGPAAKVHSASSGNSSLNCSANS